MPPNRATFALRGIANRSGNGQRKRIVTLATEHPAVLETVLDLGRSGFDSIVLPVESDGLLNLAHLDKVLDEQTLIVSVMAANNEIGVLQPITEIAALCHDDDVLFHTDATQAAGRIPIDIDDWDVDLLSFSGHKVYGPKGVGALFVRSGVQLKPIITGGSQERGLRGGTLPPALIAGFGAACDIAAKRQEEDQAQMEALTRRLYTGLLEAHPTMRLFGHAEKRLPGSLNVGLPGIPAEEVIRNISDHVAVSSGSASVLLHHQSLPRCCWHLGSIQRSLPPECVSAWVASRRSMTSIARSTQCPYSQQSLAVPDHHDKT